jgi:hypothetical protein
LTLQPMSGAEPDDADETEPEPEKPRDNGFGKRAHPNSIYGRATPEERAEIDRKRQLYLRDHMDYLRRLEEEMK